jgi:WD40 repeat protein
MLYKLVGHIYYIYSIGISPDNKKIVTGSGDGIAIIWDMNTG